MYKIKLILVLFLKLLLIVLLASCDNKTNVYSERELSEYMAMLESNPNDCYILSRIASIHQIQLDLEKSIEFFEKAINVCPNNHYSNKFDLGISYYLSLDKKRAIYYMDNAIQIARSLEENQYADSMENEKKSWLNKWNETKEWHYENYPESKGAESE
jgi:tetratricopeptide (TPR) repeat protein